jgi:hypothetical protein
MSRMRLYSSLYNSRMKLRSRSGWICSRIGHNSSSRMFSNSRMIIFNSRSQLKRRRYYKSILLKYHILVVVVSMMTLV